jgi:transposase
VLKLEAWMDIKDLHRQGHSIRTIAEMTGLARNTVRRVLREPAPHLAKKRARSSRLDPYKPYLEHRYAECALSAVRLLEEIRAMGYTGGIDVVRRFIHALDPHARSRQKMAVRFETPPGEQAQADWASCGHELDETGRRRAVYAFVMVLSYSRMLYVEFTHSMVLPELIRCHQRAFSFFGGWPHTILYDNMKQVRLSPSEWNPLFLDFLSHHAVMPKTHRVRRPRTKGKVERMVRYLKDNFLNGRSFADMNDLRAQGRHWLDQTANTRVHATTQCRPCDLLAAERLTPCSSVPAYQLAALSERRVDAESFVRLGRSRYSVPPEYVGLRVIVERGEQRVVVRAGDLVIAEHTPAPRAGACMTHKEHVEALWRLSLKRTSAPPAPSWHIGFREPVATTPLTTYEEVAR